MRDKIKINFLLITSLLLILIYLFLEFDYSIMEYILKIRAIKIFAIILTAFCISFSTIIFQSIINNNVVTPCLLGMNSMYILMNTVLIFFLSTENILVKNDNILYIINIILMTIFSLILYGAIFKKVNYNIIYILLIGTVFTGLFTSFNQTLVRLIDPNEYESLLQKITASFSKVNDKLIILSIILIFLVLIYLKNDFKYLDVISLGKDKAKSLGVDYDSVIKRFMIAISIFIAIATALVGPISFLGLIVSNLARYSIKTYENKILIIASFYYSIFVLIVAQIISEKIYNYTLPQTVFVTFFGGIYFLYLLLKKGGNK